MPDIEAASDPLLLAALAKLFCPQCGESMDFDQRYCTGCGWDAEAPAMEPPGAPARPARELGPPSDKNRLTALLLCALLGWLGVHRFYFGRRRSGFLWMVSLGLLGVGVIYDAVMLATGELVDSEGKRVLHWE